MRRNPKLFTNGFTIFSWFKTICDTCWRFDPISFTHKWRCANHRSWGRKQCQCKGCIQPSQNHFDLQNSLDVIPKVFPLPTSSFQLLSQRISYLKYSGCPLQLGLGSHCCIWVPFFLPYLTFSSKKKWILCSFKCLGSPSREKATPVGKISPPSNSLRKLRRGFKYSSEIERLEFSFSYMREKTL